MRDRSTPASHGLPLWPLPLLAGLLPCVAALLAWWLSTRLGLIPSCNVFLEGCVSVSRAARHDLPNHLFRALLLPAGALQALTWILAAHWLQGALHERGITQRGIGTLASMGVAAGVALVAYGTFLGTEGTVYRWLRQYGTVLYFGFTCIGLLLAGGAVQRLARAGALHLPRLLEHAMVALSGALVTLGIVNAIIAPMVGGEAKGRVENVAEWWGSLIFVLGFVALSWMWRRLGLRAQLGHERPR